MTDQTPEPAADSGEATPLATTATNWINRRGKHEPDLTDPETAWGRCLIETTRFVEYAATHDLKLIEVKGQNYPGRTHWATIEFNEDAPEDSVVVDVTLRQFIYEADVPWIGTLVDWYDLTLDGLVDYIDVAVYDDPQEEPYWTDNYEREDLEPGSNSYPWDRPKPDDVPETPEEPEAHDVEATAEIAAARSDALDVPADGTEAQPDFWSVPCEGDGGCGAQPGEKCRDETGKRPYGVHAQRTVVYFAANESTP